MIFEIQKPKIVFLEILLRKISNYSLSTLYGNKKNQSDFLA